MKKRCNVILLTGLLVFLLAVPAMVAAQTTGKDEEEYTSSSITVTAQKREENVQDVPISMTVLDSMGIEDRKIERVTDIALTTPSLTFNDMNFGGWSAPVMRGLSSSGGNMSSSASMFVDGIPISNLMGFDEVLTNIERIEVLRGPQGTLYGKDTQAGAINVITRQPGNDVEGKASVQLGSDDKREYSFSTAGPIITDKLFIGLSGRHYEKDGQISNPYLGGMVDDRSDNYGRIHLRATPTDDIDISLISSILTYDNGGPYYNSAAASEKEVPSDIHGFDNSETISHALKATYDLNSRFNIEGVFTQREYKPDALSDLDYSSMPIFHNYFTGSYKRRSGEVRLNAGFEKFNWLVGIYLDSDEVYQTSYRTVNGVHVTVTPQYRDDRSIGLFAHGDYQVTDKLTLIGGIRYDDDEKTFQEGTTDLSNSYSAVSPKVAVNYNFTENSMIYATVSQGYKSGGFDTVAPEGRKEFDKETLTNYEIGTKNSFLNNTLMINMALYYMDISGMQVNSAEPATDWDGSILFITNAADATSQGLELEITYRITPSLEIFGGLGINQTEFDEYTDLFGDYSGNTNPNAPRYTAHIGGQYRSSNGFFARCDLSGVGKTYLDRENNYTRDAYALVNARIGYEGDSFDIYLYADNLFDEDYKSRDQFMVFYSQPREIGAQFTYRF